MSNGLAQRFEDALKSTLPVASCLFFLLLMMVPWPSPAIKSILSAFPLMVLSFWIINKPEYFSFAWSFIIGFLQDVLLNQHLGTTTLTYLAADFFLRGQRQFFLQQSFNHLWMVFSLVMLCASTIQWLVGCVDARAWIDVTPMALRTAVGVLFFPLMTALLHHLQRGVFTRQ